MLIKNSVRILNRFASFSVIPDLRSIRFSSFTRLYSRISYKHHVGTIPLQYITLGQTLTNAAEKWPDRPAIISRHENKTITYSELLVQTPSQEDNATAVKASYGQYKKIITYNDKADKLAVSLFDLGMEPGDRFGLWLPNCTQWVIAVMAAARSGIISVAMNPLYQAREVEYCLKKVNIKTIIAQDIVNIIDYYEILNAVIPDLHSHKPGDIRSSNFETLKSIIMVTDKTDLPGIINYEKLMESVTSDRASNVSRGVIKPDHMCNIQFTSGTTGNPKAPVLTHFNIVNNGYFIGYRNELHEGHNTICVQVPLFHVFGVVVTLSAAIQHGATLVFPSARYSPRANVEAIIKEKCNVIHGTPTMHIDLVNEIRSRSIDIKADIAVTGGSPVTPRLIQDLSKVINVKRVKSIFGMTEGTAVSFQSIPGEDTKRPLSFVGHLHDHLEAKIVDENDKIVPLGTPGELLTRGYSTMCGYWDDEVKTNETIGQDGWLRSGDQMVLLEDGYGQIVGRIKDLIIRGGENIAPKEIEDVISSHPDVLECQVFGIQDDRLGEEVCAAVKIKEGAELDTNKLKKHCTEHLAKFKVPKLFKRFDDFPKTASGKIQKYKLKNMVESGKV